MSAATSIGADNPAPVAGEMDADHGSEHDTDPRMDRIVRSLPGHELCKKSDQQTDVEGDTYAAFSQKAHSRTARCTLPTEMYILPPERSP